MKNSILVVLALASVAGVVHAAGTQVHADQGKPGNQGPWPVSISGGTDGGTSISVNTTELPCSNPVESVITFDAGGSTPCPIVALAGRRTLTICNSPKNSGTPLWTVRADGVAPTTATSSPGQTLNKSDCITYVMPATLSDGGVPTRCISSLADSVITMTECK